MKFKNKKEKCDECSELYRNLKIYKGRFICYKCWRKKNLKKIIW